MVTSSSAMRALNSQFREKNKATDVLSFPEESRVRGKMRFAGEIAISDSWSREFEIRWLTLQEANAINLGQSYVISL